MPTKKTNKLTTVKVEAPTMDVIRKLAEKRQQTFKVIISIAVAEFARSEKIR